MLIVVKVVIRWRFQPKWKTFWDWAIFNFSHQVFSIGKAEKILKGSLDSIPSPSPLVQIQIKGGTVCLRHKSKKLYLYSKVCWQHPAMFCLHTFPAHISNFLLRWRWWDRIQAIFLHLVLPSHLSAHNSNYLLRWRWWDRIQAIFLKFFYFTWNTNDIQVILFEITCAIFYTNLHELFCQFISWTNWVNSGKFMDNCWISCQAMADMKKIYNSFIIINLYFAKNTPRHCAREEWVASWSGFLYWKKKLRWGDNGRSSKLLPISST